MSQAQAIAIVLVHTYAAVQSVRLTASKAMNKLHLCAMWFSVMHAGTLSLSFAITNALNEIQRLSGKCLLSQSTVTYTIVCATGTEKL